MDLTREGYAPLDLALTSFVLEIAGWLASPSEEEVDAKVAENWLEQLAATIGAIDAAGHTRLQAIAEQLASEADADPIWGGGDAIRSAASMLLGVPDVTFTDAD
jgi:hypothetical protein